MPGTGDHKSTLTDPSSAIPYLAFSPDGKTLVGGGDDGVIRFWDVHTSNERDNFTGHTSFIEDFAFSSNETRRSQAAIVTVLSASGM